MVSNEQASFFNSINKLLCRDLPADKHAMSEEQPLQVARCTKIIHKAPTEPEEKEEIQYMINVKQLAKFVVELGKKVAPTDVEEGMRVGVDRTKYQVCIQAAMNCVVC